ncbi:DNA adenine methylase [Asticcacaulis excentricus]|uniref:site-specific DNA-methyltransferase (adenine-specific) n=1 Tax=Asticcacaulis excentricus (strain ATCC 15261 / DSM 4724 / KCTC 12464 / NCIMB 9791 / VKM B-1370 / CB 48) TaxID=573065 RepID=E8RPS7_ASTEC|nr:DNA adenine methylase [Asticcacaulis excentricus]ADU12054.1 D12 class N6 adenine-specific DNA methyltransferase [Asticcacaulis excentricus CB 48]
MKCSLNVLIPVEGTEPVAPWLGGKRHLSKRICAVLAGTDHQAYVEPFVGMGGVFLRRRLRPSVEVVNDINSDLVNLYRVIQRHPQALFRELRWRPAMRTEFERLKETRDEDLTDIERAARFLYLQTLAFSGKVSGQSYGVSLTSPHNFDLSRIEPRIERLRVRLQSVVIENLDWLECITRYDRPGTLFYLDPPYWGGEGDYGPGIFLRGDFQRMADKLRSIEGRFIFSINDRPEIRAMFDWAEIEAVNTKYSVGSVDRKEPVRELLIGRGVNLSPAAPEPTLF